MKTVRGETRSLARAGLATDLGQLKVLDMRPTIIKGRAYETELKIPEELMKQIQLSLDQVRPPSVVEKHYFEGNGCFAEACLLCDTTPCAIDSCVKEFCVGMRSYEYFSCFVLSVSLHRRVVF